MLVNFTGVEQSQPPNSSTLVSGHTRSSQKFSAQLRRRAEPRILKGNDVPFEKGKSGNPGGRPKVVGEVQALARGYTSRAVETLRGIMENIKAPPAARISAAIAILDRGFGRPHQTSESKDVQKPVSEMSDEELIARIRELEEDGGTPSH